jgi:hypothetical protein
VNFITGRAGKSTKTGVFFQNNSGSDAKKGLSSYAFNINVAGKKASE